MNSSRSSRTYYSLDSICQLYSLVKAILVSVHLWSNSFWLKSANNHPKILGSSRFFSFQPLLPIRGEEGELVEEDEKEKLRATPNHQSTMPPQARGGRRRNQEPKRKSKEEEEEGASSPPEHPCRANTHVRLRR